MLVKNGHGIILRNILGKIPKAVTHMSFGVGWTGGTTSIFNTQALGFEALRIPVQASYDHLTQLDVGPIPLLNPLQEFQLVYKGEIPLSQRVSFNELGLWCGSTNQVYGDSGGIALFDGTQSETWKRTYGGTTVLLGSTTDFFKSVQKEFYTNDYFKMAQPRLGSTALVMSYPGTSGPYTYFKAVNLDLSTFSPQDSFKLALTWVPQFEGINFVTTTTYNSDITIGLRFRNRTAPITAKIPYQAVWQNGIQMNTYKIIEAKFSSFQEDITKSNLGRVIEISLSTSVPSYTPVAAPAPRLLLDGGRIDRYENKNPLYGLVFYDNVFKELQLPGSVILHQPIEKMIGFDGSMEHRVRLFANDTGANTV